MKLLENKVVLITGGSRGIGEAIVHKMASNGANVAFTYHSSAEKANAVAAAASNEVTVNVDVKNEWGPMGPSDRNES